MIKPDAPAAASRRAVLATLATFASGALALAALGSAAPAFAQAYPSKPLRMLVGFAAGGPADIIARLVATNLSTHLGQQVLVENRPGADANIAMEAAAKAPADGHTLLLGQSGLTINPSLYPKVPFDTMRDFAPVCFIGEATNLLVVHPSVPAQNLRDFIRLAKEQKGKLNYASTSSPTHLATELFNQMAGIDLVRVPYKGAAPAIPALISNDVQFMLTSIGTILPQVKAGKARALGVTSTARSSLAPDVPTVDEAGVPGYSATTWYGLLVPAGTPAAAIARLNAEMRKILAGPEIRAQLLIQSIEAAPGSPEEFGAFMKADYAKWERVVKLSGAKVD